MRATHEQTKYTNQYATRKPKIQSIHIHNARILERMHTTYTPHMHTEHINKTRIQQHT